MHLLNFHEVCTLSKVIYGINVFNQINLLCENLHCSKVSCNKNPKKILDQLTIYFKISREMM